MAEDFYQVLGRNIRERRQALGCSLEALAPTLRVSYQQLQKYEKGSNRMPAHMLSALAVKFGCSTDELCGLSTIPHSLETGELVRRFSRITSPELRNGILGLMRAAASFEKAPLE